jgi:methionyl-tRNA formyltransferase
LLQSAGRVEPSKGNWIIHMQRRIIILTGRREAPFFEQFLLERNPHLTVAAAHNLDELAAAIDRFDGDARLISFLTDTIVPPELLSRLRMTPYNIHPGPPEYPGAHPESFAIWENAQIFGVTAHEMTARVDDGPIVAVHRFPAPPKPKRLELADLTFASAVKVFAVVAAYCAETDGPMPHMDEQWAVKKRTRKQYQALCRMPAHEASDEAARLSRACGSDIVRHVDAQA